MKNAHPARRRGKPDKRLQFKTLADFQVPVPLECFHCDKELPSSTPVELAGAGGIAHCLVCGCATPFAVSEVGEA